MGQLRLLLRIPFLHHFPQIIRIQLLRKIYTVDLLDSVNPVMIKALGRIIGGLISRRTADPEAVSCDGEKILLPGKSPHILRLLCKRTVRIHLHKLTGNTMNGGPVRCQLHLRSPGQLDRHGSFLIEEVVLHQIPDICRIGMIRCRFVPFLTMRILVFYLVPVNADDGDVMSGTEHNDR